MITGDFNVHVYEGHNSPLQAFGKHRFPDGGARFAELTDFWSGAPKRNELALPRDDPAPALHNGPAPMSTRMASLIWQLQDRPKAAL